MIFEVDEKNFATHVLQSDIPVILDCYADWCGPCKQLTPLLEDATRAAGGKVRLAKLNVDFNQQISQQLQVQSLPTVIGIHKQKMVDKFMGMVAPEALEAFMQKMIMAADAAPGAAPATVESDGKAAADCLPHEAFDLGFEAYRKEQFAAATEYFDVVIAAETAETKEMRRERRKVERQEAVSCDMANSAAQQSAARRQPGGQAGAGPTGRGAPPPPPRRVPQPTLEQLTSRSMALSALSLMAAGQLPAAVEVVEAIKKDREADIALPDVSRAVALVEISDAAPDSSEAATLTARVAEDPGAHAERLKLAAGLASVGEFEEAINHGLKVVKADRSFNGGEAKTFLLRIFSVLWAQHELAKSGRKRLSNLLF